MVSAPIENRRGSPRNQIDCLIRVESLDRPAATETFGDEQTGKTLPTSVAAVSQDCIAQDVSATGVRIWADRSFARGERLRIFFGCEKVGLPEENCCFATVAWADTAPIEGRWQIGVCLDDNEASRVIASALLRGCPWCEKLCPEIV